MAGKKLRSRMLPSVAEPLADSAVENRATSDVYPKSKAGRALLHKQSHEFTSLVGPVVGGSALGTLREGGVKQGRNWELQRCNLRPEQQAMKGAHARQQEPLVPITSSSRSTGSETNEESEDDEVQVQSNQDIDGEDEAEHHISKGKKQGNKNKNANEKDGRLLVYNDHVATLVREYRKHFMEFSRGRKRKPKQLIPNKVRLKVYSSYKKQFPRSSFKLESLKIHLRDSLNDLQSGVNNPEAEGGRDGAELQDDIVMRKLYSTKGFLRRNVLQVRQRSMEGISSKGKEASQSAPPASEGTPNRLPATSQSIPNRPPATSQSTPSRPPATSESTPNKPLTPGVDKGKTIAKPFTKKEALHQASQDIASMLNEVKSIKEKQNLVASRHGDDDSRIALYKARREEAAARREEAVARADESQTRKLF